MRPERRAASLRAARPGDLRGLYRLDPGARGARGAFRRAQIRNALAQRLAIVAEVSGTIAGYAALAHGFHGRGFVEIVFVDPAERRRGIASALLRRCERICRTRRLFTSTNRSNRPMQRLLAKLGYRRSGAVADLDPGDPELFYSKLLRGPSRPGAFAG